MTPFSFDMGHEGVTGAHRFDVLHHQDFTSPTSRKGTLYKLGRPRNLLIRQSGISFERQ